MIGPGSSQLIVSVLFVSVLARPVVDVTLRLMSTPRGFAWLVLVWLGAAALWQTRALVRQR